MIYSCPICRTTLVVALVSSLWVHPALPETSIHQRNAESTQAYADHTFDFGSFGECKDVEVLNYQYGSSGATGTHAEKEYLDTGHIPQGENTSGILPIGDFLYVKWKDLNTGKVYAETVDLKSRLPSNMDHMVLHFSIEGAQLYIYVIDYREGEDLHDAGAPDCPSKLYSVYKCERIYPTHWSNYQG